MNAISKGPKSKLLKLQQVRLPHYWALVGKYTTSSRKGRKPLTSELQSPVSRQEHNPLMNDRKLTTLAIWIAFVLCSFIVPTLALPYSIPRTLAVRAVQRPAPANVL